MPTTNEGPGEFTREQIQAEVARKKKLALDHIENAQRELEYACQELSALIGGVPDWKRVGTLRDRVHAAWQRLAYTEPRGGFGLDEFGLKALRRRLNPEVHPAGSAAAKSKVFREYGAGEDGGAR